MIETERLLLRTMTYLDVNAMLMVFTDPRVMASFGVHPFTQEQMESWVRRNLKHQERHGYGLFSVILKSEGKLIGNCGLEHMVLDGEDMIELGYDFASHYWNRGFATEAASAVRDYAFAILGLKRLVSLIQSHNMASRRVSEKIGMLPHHEFSHNGHSYIVYTIKNGNC